MITFFGYIFLGLSLAAPIGPVNAAQLDKGIKNGFFHSWLVGLGAMSADILYMLAVYLGIIQFLHTDFMQTFLWSFGCFVLVYTGIEGMLNAGKIVMDARSKESDLAIRSFFQGFIIAISNPLTILFWLGIYGSLLAKTVAEYKMSTVILYSSAIILGLLIWDIMMASIASSFKRWLSGKFLIYISIVSGLSLIGFGIYFGIQAVKNLFF